MAERKKKHMEQWQDMIARLFPEYGSGALENEEAKQERVLSRTITFQVTDKCNLKCSYCYQINKGTRKMTFETAKKFIDLLLSGDKGMDSYISSKNSPAVILEFIGGEPFLEIELMDKIVDYFKMRAIELMHPWATMYCISICSNGVLYFDEKVQKFLNKHKNNLSFSITIDGNKELHDSCRVFHDGSPSYDIAVAGANDWIRQGNYMGSKITIAPENLQHLYNAITHMIGLGYTEINANCIYEEGWKQEHSILFYNELKRIADYFLDNNLVDDVFCSLFEETFFAPKNESDNQNWCFKAGTMVLTPNGNVPIETLRVGNKVISREGNVQKVSNVNIRLAHNTALIKADGVEPIYTTHEHPFLVRIKHNCKNVNSNYLYPLWLDAQKIKVGDLLALYKQETNSIEWIAVTDVDLNIEPYQVYNLTVENDHTFIANNVVVHNCGGTGHMLACDPDGYLYPCIRYMESSLGSSREPMRIGHVDTGIASTECQKDCINCLNCVTRRSQSTDECFYCPIGGGCSWCFKAGTLVLTPNGNIPIEKLKIGDKVIAGNGNVEEVENVMSRYSDDTAIIKATGLPPIYTTKEHPFLIKRFHRSGAKLLYDDAKWTKVEDIKKSDKIGLYIPKFGNVDIDKNVAYLVGRYIGDGWKVDYRRSKTSDKISSYFYICCSNEETMELEEIFQKAKVSYTKDKSIRTAQEYSIHKTNHSDCNNNELLVSILNDCGKYAYGKRIPNEVFTWNEESIRALLDGYFSADGYTEKRKNIIKINTVSKELAVGLSFLYRMIGLKTGWYTRTKNSNTIQGRKVNARIAYELSINLEENPKRKWYEISDGIMWVNVRDINLTSNGYEVFNLTVSNEHTFVADGAIVHNCSANNFQETGSPNKRVIHICEMHKARSLANVYFWNKYYIKNGIDKVFKMHCPKEWALKIISEDEYEMLENLSKTERENNL